MKIFETEIDFKLDGGKTINAHQPFVFYENFEGRLQSNRISYSKRNFDNIYEEKKYSGQNLDGKKLAIWRTAGIGDILFISSIVAYLKQKYDVFISLACGDRFVDVVRFYKRMPDYVTTVPIFLEDIRAVDYLLNFQGVLEKGRGNAYDLFFEQAGISHKDVEDCFKRPCLRRDYFYSNKKNRHRLFRKYGLDKTKKLVVLSLSASSFVKSLPPGIVGLVLSTILEAGHQIVVIDNNTKMLLPEKKGLFDARNKTSLMDCFKLISYSDLLIAPDTGFFHFAEGVAVPAIGIYGPFTGDSSARYYKTSCVIEPNKKNVVCKDFPCFDYARKGLLMRQRGKEITTADFRYGSSCKQSGYQKSARKLSSQMSATIFGDINKDFILNTNPYSPCLSKIDTAVLVREIMKRLN